MGVANKGEDGQGMKWKHFIRSADLFPILHSDGLIRANGASNSKNSSVAATDTRRATAHRNKTSYRHQQKQVRVYKKLALGVRSEREVNDKVKLVDHRGCIHKFRVNRSAHRPAVLKN